MENFAQGESYFLPLPSVPHGPKARNSCFDQPCRAKLIICFEHHFHTFSEINKHPPLRCSPVGRTQSTLLLRLHQPCIWTTLSPARLLSLHLLLICVVVWYLQPERNFLNYSIQDISRNPVLTKPLVSAPACVQILNAPISFNLDYEHLLELTNHTLKQ